MAHTHYAIIHRHGARYVCQDAFDLLANTEAVKHWQKDKIGLLTEVGIEQSEALGHHFGEIVLKDCSDPDFLWFSSDTERVVESGRAFLKGLKEKTTEEMFPRYTLDRYINDLPENLRLSGASSRLLQPREPSELFRAFKSNEAYIAEVREYFKGSTFAKQAEKEKEFLSEIIRIVLPEKAATMTLAEMLKAMDTLAGALECEFFCDSDTLINKLTPTQRDKVCSLARTIRQDIFFRLKTARTLGKPILDEILAYSRKSKVSIWSAHDHTICSILASLGMKDYPTKSPNLIAFGAYLILEIKDNQTLHDAKFNPEPFMPSAKTTVCKDNESVIRLRKTVRG